MSEFVKLRKTHNINRHHQEAAEVEAACDEQKRTAAAIAEREQPLKENPTTTHRYNCLAAEHLRHVDPPFMFS